MNDAEIVPMPRAKTLEPEPACAVISGGIHCRHGTFVCPDDAFIGRSLRYYGEYSELEVKFLVSLLKSGDVIIEAGAHVGTVTIPMARACGPNGRVYAYEPQNEIHAMLETNLEANGITNVTALRAGLGDRPRGMSYDPNSWNTGNVMLRPIGEAANLVEVSTVAHNHPSLLRLNLLKIDTEGMDVDVIAGAREHIAKLRPLIYVENDRAEYTRELVDLLHGLSYRVFRHEVRLADSDNFRGQSENIFPGITTLNLIAVPEEEALPPQVKPLVEIKPKQWAAICRFGGIGDNLVAAAVLPGLVRCGNRVEVITNALAGEVFVNNPWVDKLSICEDKDQPPGGGLEWQHWFQKRSHEYVGGLFHLSHTIETTLALVQGQTQFWWPAPVRRVICKASYVELAVSICGVALDFRPTFYPTALEFAKAFETKDRITSACGFKRHIAWVLCGSRFDKTYPWSHHAVARLIRECGAAVLLIGRPGKDYEIAKVIESEVAKINGSVHGLFLAMTVEASDSGPKADWPVRRSLAQIAACDLAIGPDTGLMWSVAFNDIPKIMLLSHASPENITKHWKNTTTLHADDERVPCWPCHRLHDVPDTCVMNKDKTGVACMSDINVETIIRVAKEAIG